MKQGFVTSGSTFAGRTLLDAASIKLFRKLTISSHKTYVLEGYLVSIQQYLFDNADVTVEAAGPVQIRVLDPVKDPTQEILDRYRGAALKVVGGVAPLVEGMNTVVGHIKSAKKGAVLAVKGFDAVQSMRGVVPSRPGKAAKAFNRFVTGKRIIVELSCGHNTNPNAPGIQWMNLGPNATFGDVAFVVGA